jgi:prepilin-type N-terminal cleavage/methylation domain-containing protein
VSARATPPPERRAGFTLVETIIALVLSSVVLVLVSTTFLAQHRVYSSLRLAARVQDNARSATERVASELRSLMDSGIVVAGPRTLTVRSPIAVVVVCDRQGTNVHVHVDGGVASLDTAEVGGVAWLNQGTGVWTYRNTTWSTIDNPGGGITSAARCAQNGADTLRATSHFRRLGPFNTLFGSVPGPGEVLLLFRETTFKIQDSELEPGRLGIFRRRYGGSFVELASGMDASARFQYRTGGTSYADTVAAPSLGTIDAVRIVADARAPAPSGGSGDVTFGWAVNVALRNVR